MSVSLIESLTVKALAFPRWGRGTASAVDEVIYFFGFFFTI